MARPRKRFSIVCLRVQAAAKRVGIHNANHLALSTGLSTNTTYDIWEGVAKRIDLETLAILCDAFQCSVQRILVKTWSEKPRLLRREKPVNDKTKRKVIQL